MNKILFLLGLTSLVITSCTSTHGHKAEESKYIVTSPIKKDTLIEKDYVCQIHSISHIELRALEKGYLQEIYVDEGQLVKKGQILFQVMPLLYKAEKNKAQAEANFAQIEYQNAKSLADSNIISSNELALVKAKYDKALAELELSNVHLGFTEIRAPFDGYVGRFRVRLGSLLDEGELLTTLSDNEQLWVYFNMPEAEYLDYKQKLKQDSSNDVDLIMANGQKFNHSGEIETIEADFNNETGNIAFRALFLNPERLLRHGETGSVRMTSKLDDALLIPQKATYEILDKRYVYVIGKDNVVTPRQIEIGEELPHLYVITGGLTEDDKILLEGLRKVKAKDKIKYDFEDPKHVISHLTMYAE